MSSFFSSNLAVSLWETGSCGVVFLNCSHSDPVPESVEEPIELGGPGAAVGVVKHGLEFEQKKYVKFPTKNKFEHTARLNIKNEKKKNAKQNKFRKEKPRLRTITIYSSTTRASFLGTCGGGGVEHVQDRRK